MRFAGTLLAARLRTCMEGHTRKGALLQYYSVRKSREVASEARK